MMAEYTRQEGGGALDITYIYIFFLLGWRPRIPTSHLPPPDSWRRGELEVLVKSPLTNMKQCELYNTWTMCLPGAILDLSCQIHTCRVVVPLQCFFFNFLQPSA